MGHLSVWLKFKRFLQHQAPLFITIIILFFSQQTIAALTNDDIYCANEGGVSGTCFYDPACVSTPSNDTSSDTSSSSLDLSSIASKYSLQSAVVEQVGGSVIGSYNADQPPITPASTMKLIIADVLIRSGLSLAQVVPVNPDLYYAGSNSLSVSSISLGDAMDKMLSVSDNTAANVLMQALGGVSNFTSLAQSYGYTHTTVKGYYDPSNDDSNASTIGDETAAMNHIFRNSGKGYDEAQQDLEDAAVNDNFYNVPDEANKWAGTSQVAGNVAKLTVNGTDYIIGVYINGADSDSTVAANILNSTQAIASSLNSTSSAVTTNSDNNSCSCTASSSTTVSGTISPEVGKGLPAADQANLQKAIVAGATKWHVDPNFLASIYYIENFQGGDSGGNDAVGTPVGDGQWRDPAPPYGHGPPYVNSGSSAEGPFQFESGTWTTNAQDATGNGNPSPFDLDDAAMGAAKLLASLGAANTTSEANLKHAAYSYNGQGPMAVTYSIDVYSVYSHLSGGGQSNVSGSTGSGCSLATSANCSSGGNTTSGDATILCEAEQYNGIYYSWGGGHAGYSNFRQACPLSAVATAGSSSTAQDPGPCGTDCSGLVSMALDQAFNQTYDWTVDSNGIMEGPGAQYWKSIPMSQVQPGDIVTLAGGDGHVEIVDHVSGNILDTFGSHYPGTRTGEVSSAFSYWTGGAFEWIGPGSNSGGQ